MSASATAEIGNNTRELASIAARLTDALSEFCKKINEGETSQNGYALPEKHIIDIFDELKKVRDISLIFDYDISGYTPEYNDLLGVLLQFGFVRDTQKGDPPRATFSLPLYGSSFIFLYDTYSDGKSVFQHRLDYNLPESIPSQMGYIMKRFPKHLEFDPRTMHNIRLEQSQHTPSHP